jgi:hypothetical protein
MYLSSVEVEDNLASALYKEGEDKERGERTLSQFKLLINF